eukprot:9139882-Pyramimonas_sp.AAC.1
MQANAVWDNICTWLPFSPLDSFEPNFNKQTYLIQRRKGTITHPEQAVTEWTVPMLALAPTA